MVMMMDEDELDGEGEEEDEYFDEEDLKLYEQYMKQQKEMSEDEAESAYSEGEIYTRIKLLNEKSNSAPYILFTGLYKDHLNKSEISDRAMSTGALQSMELEAEGEGEEEEELDEANIKQLMQQ